MTGTSRGGRRLTPGRARFTAQLITLDTPANRDRILHLAKTHNLSQAKIMRAIVRAGLAAVETGLDEGTLTADTLA